MQSKRIPPPERVYRHIEVTALGCWEFTGTLNHRGYGKLLVDGREKRAHRIAYEDWFGPIPEGMTIDHLCLNKRCVFPPHLEVVTRGENVRRQIAAGLHHPSLHGQAGACHNGHPWTEASTYVFRNGSRRCRICERARERARYLRQKEKE